MFSVDNNIYSISELPSLLEKFDIVKDNKKKHCYLNVASSFDIETTSFYIDIATRTVCKRELTAEEIKSNKYEKQALMYAFCFGINGKVVLARTWDDFKKILSIVRDFYHLSNDLRLIVYVHNLSFEFEFIKDLFTWDEFFSLDERKPVKIFASEYGIEFRDSYALTGYSLEKVGEHLTKYPVKKLMGDLDYSLFRSPETPLSDKEKGYIRNDVQVVMSHIQQEIEKWGAITKLPLTKTGYVRNYVRRHCLYGENGHKRDISNLNRFYRYHEQMLALQITSLEEYKQLQRGFAGGFTHGNALYNDEILTNVTSLDFTSSYPSVMLDEKYPCATGKLVDIENKEQMDRYLSKYCCLFDIEFFDLEETFLYDHYISLSKCFEVKGEQVDNGRIVKAKHLKTTLTEQDFDIIRKTYKWKKITVSQFRIYMKQYLPKSYVECILKFYNDKTQLKDVAGKEEEYLWSKELLNSLFGMTVTDIAKDNHIYDNKHEQWVTSEKEKEDQIKRYNVNKSRFLCYQWGVWVTAYARHNLWEGIMELGKDHGYTDTDSLKMKNYESHKKFFEDYNNRVKIKLQKAMDYWKLPMELTCPKTIKGVEKQIGVWDFDGHYKRFKFLGAKRYMIENDEGKHSLTVSGVNKKVAIPWLENYANVNKFDIMAVFSDGLFLPKEATGKNVHTYIDFPMKGTLTDYLGNRYNYIEKSGVHLEGTSYDLSIAQAYADFVNYVKGELYEEER